MNIPRLLGVLFEIKAEGTTVHLDVRRYPRRPALVDTEFHLSRPRVIAQRDDCRPRVTREGCLSFVARMHAVTYFSSLTILLSACHIIFHLPTINLIFFLLSNEMPLQISKI